MMQYFVTYCPQPGNPTDFSLSFTLKAVTIDVTFTARFSLVPGPIFSAAQNAVPWWFHQVTRVTAVGHCVVKGELTS